MKQMESAIREPSDPNRPSTLGTDRPPRAYSRGNTPYPPKNLSARSQGQDGTVGSRRNEDCLAIVGAVAPSRGQDFLLHKTEMREKTEQMPARTACSKQVEV